MVNEEDTRMSRLELLAPATLTGAQRALYDAITSGRRTSGPQHFAIVDEDGSLRGPFNAFLLSPAIGGPLQEVGAAIRYESLLTDRCRELAILLVAARWNSTFERESHEAVGAAVGLTADEMSAVARSALPELTDPSERACVALTLALLDGDIDDDVWAEHVPALGLPLVFELSALVGYYATLALQLRVFRIDPQTARTGSTEAERRA